MGRRSNLHKEMLLFGALIVGLIYVLYGTLLAISAIVKWTSQGVGWLWGKFNTSSKQRAVGTGKMFGRRLTQDAVNSRIVRKSVHIGPILFSLSDSGVNVTADIAGMKIGMGPRGNFVKLGVNGLIYSRTLAPTITEEESSETQAEALEQNHDGSSTATTRSMYTTSGQILKEIQIKAHRTHLAPIVGGVALVLLLVLYLLSVSTWVLVVATLLGIIGSFAMYLNDLLRTSVVLMYDMDESLHARYEAVCQAVAEMAASDRVWHLPQIVNQDGSQTAEEIARNGGRNPVTVTYDSLDFIKTNIDVPVISFASNHFLFFPDRILVFQGPTISSVEYEDLQIIHQPVDWVEKSPVPADAVIVSREWANQNKDGSPDRRFKHNYQIPTCRYESLSLQAHGWLREWFTLSSIGAGSPLKASCRLLANSIEAAKVAESHRRQQEDQLELKRSERIAAQEAQHSAADEFPAESAGEIESLDEALLHVLCCVMVADGKASKSERIYIHQQMKKLEIHWDTKIIEDQINQFVEHVKFYGGKHVLKRTVSQIPWIKESGKSQILADCLNGLIVADDNVDERELLLCSKLTRMLE